MAIYDSGDNVQKWRYHLTELNLLIDNMTPMKIPSERFLELEICEDYEELFFPLIKIKLMLTPHQYYLVLADKNNCKIHLRVDKYYNDVDSKDKSLNRVFINDTFMLVLDDSNEDLAKSLKEEENKSDYTTIIKSEENDPSKLTRTLEVYLFKNIIDGTKKQVNKVLIDCNVTDAISYIATVGEIKNIVMCQPDNTKKYKELLIPPMNVTDALYFIDNYYGIYKTGSIIYFGTKYTYIIPYDGSCKAYVKGEIKNINIVIPKSANNKHGNNVGVLNKRSDVNNIYLVADYSSLKIENQSISNDYIDANDVQVVDSYDDKVTDYKSNATSKGKNSFTKVKENNTENEFVGTTLSAQSKAKSVVISANLRDYDVNVITPNKRYNMIFEDASYTKKYNGNYIISKAVHTFMKEGEDIVVNSNIILKKS